ncbi:MAG: ABC transporter ATP-binding protein [Rhizobiales bacterium]|nr:ABC transporter ATP-binding protein [Hyphomicrobiales bacterium]
MLEVRSITAGYDGSTALDDVSIEIRDGELVGLLGANNAGKSTLINCLSGIVKPRAGSIHFEGEDISGLAPHEVVERGIIQVPEGRLVFPQMSVRENLLMGGVGRQARALRSERMDKVLVTFPRLQERLAQDAGTLSGGEQQMLAIGRGMMAGARVLMLDEPSLGLSPLFVQYIFETIRALHDGGLTILLVEQNSNLTFRHASRCYVLERGRVAIHGPSSVVKDDPATRKAYLGL